MGLGLPPVRQGGESDCASLSHMEPPAQETPEERDFRLWLDSLPAWEVSKKPDPGIDAKEALKRKKIAAAQRKRRRERRQQGIPQDTLNDIIFGHLRTPGSGSP